MERCERFLDLISQSLDGQLTDKERQTLDEHLSQCPDCRALLAELSEIHNEFSVFEEQDVPQSFTQGVMDRVRAVENSKKIIPLWKRPQVRAWGSLAACAVLCVGLMKSGVFSSAGESAPMAAPASAPAVCSAASATENACAEEAAFSLERSIEAADIEAAPAAEVPASALADSVYLYPITPEDSEWAELSTDEKRDMCQIPEDVLSGMSTSSLVETVLDYPYLVDIYAFDTLKMGIETVSGHFNGLQELLSRDDAAEHLKTVLEKYPSDDFKHMAAEVLVGYIESDS